jgi:hypothetical protein
MTPGIRHWLADGDVTGVRGLELSPVASWPAPRFRLHQTDARLPWSLTDFTRPADSGFAFRRRA